MLPLFQSPKIGSVVSNIFYIVPTPSRDGKEFQSPKIGSVVSNSQKIINLEKFTSF